MAELLTARPPPWPLCQSAATGALTWPKRLWCYQETSAQGCKSIIQKGPATVDGIAGFWSATEWHRVQDRRDFLPLCSSRYQMKPHTCARTSLVEPPMAQGQTSHCHSHSSVFLHSHLQNTCFLQYLGVVLGQHFPVTQRYEIRTSFSYNRCAKPFPSTKQCYLTS